MYHLIVHTLLTQKLRAYVDIPLEKKKTQKSMNVLTLASNNFTSI